MWYLSASNSDWGLTVATLSSLAFFAMEFPERLATLRKERGLTQQALADQVGLAVLQIRRYEGGTSQPTLDVIRRLAIALGSSADTLVFDEHERGPADSLRYQFEAVSRMSEHDQEMIRELLDAVIVRNQVAGALERVKLSPIKPTTRSPRERTSRATSPQE
jgi:transcriptional regulator with XRE-family HTH domain